MLQKLSYFSIAVAIMAISTHPSFGEKAKVTYSTITVKDMHCKACAKKVADKLYRVAGVKEVRADVKKNIAYVIPETRKLLSARKLWEAVEAAGFSLVKLSTPDGDFTRKPKQ